MVCSADTQVFFACSPNDGGHSTFSCSTQHVLHPCLLPASIPMLVAIVSDNMFYYMSMFAAACLIVLGAQCLCDFRYSQEACSRRRH